MGYGIYSRGMGSLQDDASWEQLRFRQNHDLSCRVFELMDGGKKIYPDESLDCVRFHIDSIARATSFSEDAFEYALRRSHLFRESDAEMCQGLLSRFTVDDKNFEIGKRPWALGKSRILQVNMQSEADRSWAEHEMRICSRMSVNYLGSGFWGPWMLPERPDMPGIGDMSPRLIEGFDHANILDRVRPELDIIFRTGKLPNH